MPAGRGRGPADVPALVERLRSGDRRAVARLISLVEDGAREASEVLRAVYPLTGHAVTIGATGSPGVGKSTLVDALVGRVRAEGRTVGVVAVDPTSPFSGGALLGDRVRMQEHALDPGVFIRSMATRGHLGGLSLAVPEVMRVLEAAGFDLVLVETVGVGQSEVEIAGQADTTIVTLAPGMGDAIQAAKAGILEVADVFCVNKADKEGARDTARDLRSMLELGPGRDPDWAPPIVLTSASTGQGIDELWEAVGAHREHLSAHGRLESRRRARLAGEIKSIAAERLRSRLLGAVGAARFEDLVARVAGRELDPYSAADELLGGPRGVRPCEQLREEGLMSDVEPGRLPAVLVNEFVGAAHVDFDRVREMLDAEPGLLNSAWDWGGGDWETGLGGASHMGRRDIAQYLMSRGARVDVFAAAMLGWLDVVRSVIEASPETARALGPHGIPLIAHAKAGGDEAASVLEYLSALQQPAEGA